MSNKIVYYMDSFKAAEYSAANMFEILCAICKEYEYEVYYVNHIHENDQKHIDHTGIIFEDIDTCDFSKFEDAVFITPAHHVFDLLTRTTAVENARIALVFNDPPQFNWMLSHIPKQERNKKELADFLSSKGCVFFDKKSLLGAKKAGIICDDPVIVPFVYSDIIDKSLVDKNNIKLCPIAEGSLPKRISIGWFGPVTPRALTSITNLADNLYNFYKERITAKQKEQMLKNCLKEDPFFNSDDNYRELNAFEAMIYNSEAENFVQRLRSVLDSPVDEPEEYPVDFPRIELHIIGMGAALWKMDFRKYSPIIRFVFTGNLRTEKSREYIHNNVDILVAYDQNALIGAYSGVPVVVPVAEQEAFRGNRYVYLSDTQQGALSWTNVQLKELGYPVHPIKEIIYDIYGAGRKAEFAENSFNTALSYYSGSAAAARLTEHIESSALLSLNECREFTGIAALLADFNSFLSENPGADYPDYRGEKPKNEEVPETLTFKQKLKKRLPKSFLYPEYYKAQRSYPKKIRKIRKLYRKNKKLKVAFLVVFDVSFPSRAIFEKMLEDDMFDPYIIAIPDVERTYQFQLDTLEKTFGSLYSQYHDRVICGYDEKTDTYYDLGSEYSIVFFCNPYKTIAHPLHDVYYFLDKNVLTVYTNYAFATLRFWDELILGYMYNMVWRANIDTVENMKYLKENQQIKGKNAVVTGCLKLDRLAEVPIHEKKRKMIMICPHHTVWGWSKLNISNFLKYSELFVELPKKYPEVDFVFRPHPLLIVNLLTHNVWTQAEIDEYFERLLQSPNIIYDNEGEYLERFANSDAMIHDCGSFIAEYLYTEKPCCYMLKSEEAVKETLLPIGQACMDQYYHAFNEEDICNFIENVVINGDDPKKEERENFSKKVLKCNFPNSSQNMIDHIKKALL